MNISKLLKGRHVPITRRFTLPEYRHNDLMHSSVEIVERELHFVFSDRDIKGIRSITPKTRAVGYGFDINFKGYSISIVRNDFQVGYLDGMLDYNNDLIHESEFRILVEDDVNQTLILKMLWIQIDYKLTTKGRRYET